MRAVFLVPRRDDGGHRDRLWAYAKARWQQYFPGIPVVEGHHNEGPFSRAAAINRAAAAAGAWDVGIVIDSDVLLSVSQINAALARARAGEVTWAHRRWRGVREDATLRLLDGFDFGPELDRDAVDLIVERTNPLSWSCCIAVPRATFDDMGGFDERFRGWGFEDMAFQSLVVGLYPWARIEGDVVHLWHPRSEERIVVGQPRLTATPEYVTNARLGRRYMVALRRDHGQNDRGYAATPEEMKRDIANLQLDDAAYKAVARRLKLPDWSGWWPTLEELRDGAKGVRIPDGPTVTVVLRTGGEPDVWEERAGYLRQSLESLAANLTGPIVQRVIYSDWPNERRPELEAIGAPYGFYVVGDGHHGYTMSTRRLWKYLATRARGSHVFQVEDDFIYHGPVDLDAMLKVATTHPHLAQLALLREPAYAAERASGGVLGWPVESFTPQRLDGYGWLEHRNFWTMNPCLFRKSIVENPWPQAKSSERVFGDALLRDPKLRFAFWGDGTAAIRHIGETRAGTAY